MLEIDINDKLLGTIADYIYKNLGIVYRKENFYQLQTRLQNICIKYNFENLQSFWSTIQIGTDLKLINEFLDLSTNNETFFFRDREVFKKLQSDLLYKLIDSWKCRDHLKIWSCACSTGQEIYSLSIMLQEMSRVQPFYYSILASDVSDNVLARSKEGKYNEVEISRGLSPQQIKSYFSEAEEQNGLRYWRVVDSLKSHIQFKKINLLSNFNHIGFFHIIFCRNVLIYQNVENKKKIVKKLYDQLMPGGVLIIGASETMIGVTDMFKTVREGTLVYYQKPFTAGKDALAG